MMEVQTLLDQSYQSNEFNKQKQTTNRIQYIYKNQLQKNVLVDDLITETKLKSTQIEACKQCPKTEISRVWICLEDTTIYPRLDLESDESSMFPS